MLRCITTDNKTLIASSCEEKDIRKLSREKNLNCPNCRNKVIFKKGKVMRAHFAHSKSECVVTNYEPETDSHIKGKEILFNWIKSKFPEADVQYEVYIPETRQIADIFVKHEVKGMEGVRWAFEFQHSPLSPEDWEKRHELYESEGIQDFWILDKAKYMKFSSAQGIEDARLRKELEKTIFNETGLCYFLDLETFELTIDFEFITSTERRIINRMEVKTDYIYHSPIHHFSPIDQINVRFSTKFKHGVLIYNGIEDRMKDRISWISQKLKRKQELLLAQDLKECALQKREFALGKYGEETTDIIWRFMKENKEELTDDIRELTEPEFFEKYNELIERLLHNLKEFKAIEASNELTKKLIGKIHYESDLYKMTLLIEQASQPLEEFLTTKSQEKIAIVEYAYGTYQDVLEKIASYRPKFVNDKLGNIKSSLTSWESKPTAIDYAIQYRWLKTKDEVDDCIDQIKKKIINFNPFEGMEGF